MSPVVDDGIDARVLPHNLEAERAVLGGALCHHELVPVVAPLVRADQFYRQAHQWIYQAMLELGAAHVTPDLVTVKDKLAAVGKLDEVGGPAYIASLVDGVPRSINIEHYCQLVREKATLRALIVSAQKTIARAYDAQEPAADVLEAAQHDLFTVADGQTVGGGFVGASALMAEALAELETRAADSREFTGVPSGFRDLDQMTLGWQPGDVILIAARPSMGKTSFAQAIAVYAATLGRIQVGLFSVEMHRTALALRLLASESGIDTMRVQRGKLSSQEWAKVSLAMSRLADSGLHVDDSSDLTVFDIRAKARRLQAEHGLGLVIVDYLQLMRATERGENRNLEVAAISRGLKMLARDLKVPVIVLSQLSRDPEKRGNHRPTLSDLRDSGSLEQDADLVLFPYREEVYAPTPENHGIAEIIVGKQRNGPTGSIQLSWFEHLTRFENVQRPVVRP